MPPRRKQTGENSSSSASSSKRQKKKQQQSSKGNDEKNSSSSSSRDIISSLPDTILHHILSFLDMKHVVQTSILSKRWTNLWASLGSLKFDSELFHSPKKNWYDDFLNFVDQVLFLRDNYSDIQIFHLWSGFENCEVNIRLYKWIISVLKSKVGELKIVMDALGDGLRFPNRLFTSNSLTKLTLALRVNKGRWSITLPADSSMYLPNLKDLELYAVSFHDENLTNKFFSSFPNLEELYLDDVEFLHMNINISALKLVALEVSNHVKDYGYCHWPNTKFNLHAPNLLHLTCKDYMSKDYILEDLSSLVRADIHMKIEQVEDVEDEEDVEDQNPGLHYSMLPEDKKQMYAQRMMQCLKALLYVKILKLSAWFLEVMSGSSVFVEIQPTKLCHLRCLRLETWLSWNTIRSITYLLNISPNLNYLFLKINEKKSDSENIGNYPEAEVSLRCLLDNLECVEIEGAVGCVNELKFLEILLKNAKVLEKLVVYTSTEQLPDRKKRFTKFTEKLLTFPKASSDITILVC